MAAADGRSPAGGVDRPRAAPPAGRAGRAAPVLGVGISPADPPAGPGEAGAAGRAVHRAGVHANDRIEVDTMPVTDGKAKPALAREEPKAALGRSLPPL